MCHVVESLLRVYAQHGVGYHDTTYQGLLSADRAAEMTPLQQRPNVDVAFNGEILGTSDLKCIVVDEAVAVMIIVLYSNIRAAGRRIMQTYLRLLNLDYDIIANFGNKTLQLQPIQHQ
jgi:GxxExxY protein